MTKIERNDLDFLLSMAGWLFAEGMAMFTEEDEINFWRIDKKYAKQKSKG